MSGVHLGVATASVLINRVGSIRPTETTGVLLPEGQGCSLLTLATLSAHTPILLLGYASQEMGFVCNSRDHSMWTTSGLCYLGRTLAGCPMRAGSLGRQVSAHVSRFQRVYGLHFKPSCFSCQATNMTVAYYYNILLPTPEAIPGEEHRVRQLH